MSNLPSERLHFDDVPDAIRVRGARFYLEAIALVEHTRRVADAFWALEADRHAFVEWITPPNASISDSDHLSALTMPQTGVEAAAKVLLAVDSILGPVVGVESTDDDAHNADRAQRLWPAEAWPIDWLERCPVSDHAQVVERLVAAVEASDVPAVAKGAR